MEQSKIIDTLEMYQQQRDEHLKKFIKAWYGAACLTVILSASVDGALLIDPFRSWPNY